MSWLDPDLPMIPMAFINPQGGGLSVEIFPSRTTAPHGLLYGLRALAGAMLVGGDNPCWTQTLDASMAGAGKASNPFFTVHKGGAVITDAQPLPGAYAWRLDGHTLTEPDGTTWPAKGFAPFVPYASYHASQPMPEIASPQEALFAATLAGLDGAPYDNPFMITSAFLSIAAPLLTPAGRKRRIAADQASDLSNPLLHTLIQQWRLRPDRPWMPQRWVAQEELRAIARHIPQQDPDLFVACVRGALDIFLRADADVRRACWDQSISIHNPTSAHLRLRVATLTQAISHHLCTSGAAWFSQARARHAA